MDVLSAVSMPWLDEVRAQLSAAHSAGRLPHSLLVLSNPGLGAEALARWIGALALCEGSPAPCGTCASCVLLAADTHPDIHRVHVEDDAKQIKVDQVRELIETLGMKSYRGGYKVGIIEGAELLNVNGANAFLKTLEEPTPRTVLILIAKPSNRLPATIASRCLRLSLRAPDATTALEWLSAHAPIAGSSRDAWGSALSLAAGAPLLAAELAAAGMPELDAAMRESLRQLADDKVDVSLLAEHWARTDPALRITWLENWITRRIRTALAGPPDGQNEEPVRLPAALLKVKIRALYELQDALRDYRRLGSTGLNQQLALEALLIGGRAALKSEASTGRS